MLVIRNVIKRVPIVGKDMLALQVRNNNGSATWGYPRHRMSFPEKVAHGLFIATGILAFPTYFFCNLKYYSPPKSEE